MNKIFAILVSVSIACVSAQRGSYAGPRPGWQTSTQASDVGNRIGDTTTQRLPYDAYGDAVAVQLGLAKPEGHQPFWLLNQGAIEAHRGGDNRPPSNSIANRFGESSAGSFDPTSINKVSQQEIVYPVNVNAPQVPINNQQPSVTSTPSQIPSTIQPVVTQQQGQQGQQTLSLQQQMQEIQRQQEILRQQQLLIQQQLLQQQQQQAAQQAAQQQTGQQRPVQSQPIQRQQFRPQQFDQQQQGSDSIFNVAPFFGEFDY